MLLLHTLPIMTFNAFLSLLCSAALLQVLLLCMCWSYGLNFPLSCPAVGCCQNCCTTACLPNCMCKHKRLAIHPAGGADTVGEVIQTYPGCCRWVHSCGLCISRHSGCPVWGQAVWIMQTY